MNDKPLRMAFRSLAWASDCRTLFYTVFNDAHRPYKVFRHTVRDDPSRDVLVYHETDESYYFEVVRSAAANTSS